MKRILVFGGFHTLTKGHASFLRKAKTSSGEGRLLVALDDKPCETFLTRKASLLDCGYVDDVIPVAAFRECAALIDKYNIDIYAYGNPKFNLENIECETVQIISERLHLPFFVTVVGRRCTLKCKNCSNLIPYSSNKRDAYDCESILADLQAVTSVADIGCLQFQGGEPFLYQNLDRLLDFALSSEAIASVRIATNGTVMPNVNLTGVLQSPKLEVRMSNYPIASKKAEEVKNYLNQHGIKNFVFDFVSEVGLWNDLGTVNVDPSTGDIAEIFSNCSKNHCLTLENGIIGYCSRSICAPEIQKFTPNDGDYVTIKRGGVKERLRDYVYNPKYMEACRYCNGGYSNGLLVEAALQCNERFDGNV